MRIDVLTVTGSPKGVYPDELDWPGVGGAEKALIEMFRHLAKRGYEVNIYNDPRQPGIYDGVNYRPETEFDPNFENRILVTWRGPHRLMGSKRLKHVGYSTDQFTDGDYRDWYANVDEMMGISEYHWQDHIARYGEIAKRMKYYDIGVDVEEYYPEVSKVPYRIIFTSVPDRGLEQLRQIVWPVIKKAIPELKLYITSSYGLWNGGKDEGNLGHKLKWAGTPDVKFLGRIKRKELVEYQMSSEALVYPCVYEENYCIAAAEAQVAGAFPFTTRVGALRTTNQFGYLAMDFDELNNKVIEFFRKPIEERLAIEKDCRHLAIERFSWNSVMNKIVKEIFTV